MFWKISVIGRAELRRLLAFSCHALEEHSTTFVSRYVMHQFRAVEKTRRTMHTENRHWPNNLTNTKTIIFKRNELLPPQSFGLFFSNLKFRCKNTTAIFVVIRRLDGGKDPIRMRRETCQYTANFPRYSNYAVDIPNSFLDWNKRFPTKWSIKVLWQICRSMNHLKLNE